MEKEKTVVGTETRQDDYDICVKQGLPIPELIVPAKGVESVDVNNTDVRDIYDDETRGPWRRAKG